MKFCTKCGNKITGEGLFCTKCGDRLSKDTISKTESGEENTLYNNTESGYDDNSLTNKPPSIDDTNSIANDSESEYESKTITSKTDRNTTTNSKLSKKSKISMAIVIVLIVAIVAFIQVGNYLSNPKNIVTRFEKDIAANNISDLTNILYCNDARLTVDSKNVLPLLAYFKSNPSYFNEAIQDLNNDSLSLRDITTLNAASSNTLDLANVGKNLLIFNSYKIIIKPSFVDITTGVKDVTLSLNNAQIGKSEADNSTKEFGPYIPGNYSISANFNGKYVTLDQIYPINLVSTTNGIAKLDIFTDMSYLNITSDYPEAKIFLNGKDLNLEVKDATNLGPVDGSSKIYATYVKDGKTLKSDEYSVSNGDKNPFLSFQNSSSDLSDVENQLKDLMNYYTTYFTQAINSNNISLIDPYVVAGSSLYKAQQSYIPKTYTDGVQEYIVSANITNYSISDDSKSGVVTTSEVYNIVAKDGTSSNKSFNYVYNFQYNDSTSSYQLSTIK